MKQFNSFIYAKTVSQSFDEKFSITTHGIYVFEITALAKSWWQNTIERRSFLLKDSLTILLDDRDIAISSQKKKIFADDLWNGNILKDNEFTVYVITYLEAGNHSVSFRIHGQPYLNKMSIGFLESRGFILKKLAIKERDRIPYLTCIIDNRLRLTDLTITAHAGKEGGDDDDIALRVDNTLIHNNEKRAHTYWYWCGKSLKGSSKTLSQSYEISNAPSRIDITADGSPHIDEFSLTVEISQPKDTPRRPREYKAGSNGENYNTYDDIIADVVRQWNDEFFKKNQPPPTSLDPSLIKAIAYVESRLGYGANTVGYAAYPDIMQVGDPRNPAIHALKGEEKFREREWDDGDTMSKVMAYDAIEIRDPHDSVYWGVRWLYHKAQYIENNKRNWRSWEDAVEGYHKNGDTVYKKNVLKIYSQGRDSRGIIIWLFILFSILSIGSYQVMASQEEKYDGQEILYGVMKNTPYSIDGQSVRLTGGEYYFLNTLKNKNSVDNPYDFETGPYSVRFEKGAIGDLNGDGLPDGVVVLVANYGGTANHIHLAVILDNADSIYRHVGSVVYDDRDTIKDVRIDNGVVVVSALVHDDNDPLCCPTKKIIKKYTVADFIPEGQRR